MGAELDVLLLDLPPGTGDVQLTLVQRVPLAGAVIVSTPQEMALADVRRGSAMFEKTHAPILGVVENMAWFEAPDGKRAHIFGEGGARRTAEQAGRAVPGRNPDRCRAARELRRRQAAGGDAAGARRSSARFRDIAEAALLTVARLNKPPPKITLV